jgi:glycosyltransferase involved in cell wall biosynthesis
MTSRDRLAVLGGFMSVPASQPHGTNHAGTAISRAIARTSKHAGIDAFFDDARQILKLGGLGPSSLDLPQGRRVEVFDKRDLPARSDLYEAVYATGQVLFRFVPHALRPLDDWAPVVCEVDITHAPSQWTNLLAGLMTGAVRPTDGFIFKAEAQRRAFVAVAADWKQRFRGDWSLPESLVSANGVDAASNRRHEGLRAVMRAELGIADDHVVFLAFSRLERHNKGDPRSIVALWREVVDAVPGATLVLAGAVPKSEHGFVDELSVVARRAGVGDRVVIVRDPFERWHMARNGLMSAADVFLHLTTGMEETCTLVVLEAMAHGLPCIASHWSGLPDVLREDDTGWLIPTRCTVPPAFLAQGFLGREPALFNGDLSRLAAIDATRFIEVAIRVARDAELRMRVGAAALRAVTQHHDLDRLAEDRLEFAARLAHEAERGWRTTSPQWHAPLVDVAAVLRSLATGHIEAGDTVELGSEQRIALLPAFEPAIDAEARSAFLERVTSHLRSCGRSSVGELAAVVGVPGASPGDPGELFETEDGRVYGELLAQLAAYGIVRLSPGQ